jgi:hypothetical protein
MDVVGFVGPSQEMGSLDNDQDNVLKLNGSRCMFEGL